jgi:hypothetical protein
MCLGMQGKITTIDCFFLIYSLRAVAVGGTDMAKSLVLLLRRAGCRTVVQDVSTGQPRGTEYT